MIGLTDNQLATIMDTACTLPVEKRDLYLRRIAAMTLEVIVVSKSDPTAAIEGSR